jgi:hypothetical protein
MMPSTGVASMKLLVRSSSTEMSEKVVMIKRQPEEPIDEDMGDGQA